MGMPSRRRISEQYNLCKLCLHRGPARYGGPISLRPNAMENLSRVIDMPAAASVLESSHKPAGVLAPGRAGTIVSAVESLFAQAVSAVFTPFYRLSNVPPGIKDGEEANRVDALQAFQGKRTVYFSVSASGHEAMAKFSTALATRLTGSSLLAFHLPPALDRAATLFVTSWMGLLLFWRYGESRWSDLWRGLQVTGIGDKINSSLHRPDLTTRRGEHKGREDLNNANV